MRVFDRSEWIAVQFWGEWPCSYCGDPGNWIVFSRIEEDLSMRLCRYHAIMLGFEDPFWKWLSRPPSPRPLHLPSGYDGPGPRAMRYAHISRLLRRLQRDKVNQAAARAYAALAREWAEKR